jgi:hypothetical protein
MLATYYREMTVADANANCNQLMRNGVPSSIITAFVVHAEDTVRRQELTARPETKLTGEKEGKKAVFSVLT